MISEALLDRILPTVTKPARYTGQEWNHVRKDWSQAGVKVALAYPDAYEVGMSNLGLAILYDLLNQQPEVLAERVYAPWLDMERAMRQAGIPLFSLESRHSLREFDIVGFSLQYELNYSNVLNMLDLAGIPLLASRRAEVWPLIIGGGTCTYNAEPLADFFDLFVIGEGEEVLLELVRLYGEWKDALRSGGTSREEFLCQAAAIEGVYVPSLYRIEYNADGTVSAISPLKAGSIRPPKSANLPVTGVTSSGHTFWEKARPTTRGLNLSHGLQTSTHTTDSRLPTSMATRCHL